jgi:hypothetical protein
MGGFTFKVSGRKTWSWEEMDVTTDQVTTTPALRKDIPANTDGCYVMQVLANRYTATGAMDLRYEVSGWIGVKHKDKASYNQGVQAPSQYHIFDFYSESVV